MATMKIMIVEDDLLLSMGLAENLEGMGYEVVPPCRDSEEAIDCLDTFNPDLAILDIDLKGSALDGIEIAEHINRTVNIPIVFLSAIGGSETINRAKRVNPSYYLIKPYNLRQLRIALDFALSNYISKREPSPSHSLRLNDPIQDLVYRKEDCFFIKKNGYYNRVDFNDVLYVQSESPGNNITIFTTTKQHFVPVGLKKFCEQIDNLDFMRIHRKYLVNLDKVQAFNAKEVVLNKEKDMCSLPIGATYKDEFIQRFTLLRGE